MSADRPEPPGWGGPAREERAELEWLRDQADASAADAARTIAELTERLSPRNLLSPRRIAARLAGPRTRAVAAVALPVAAALAAVAVAAAAALAAARRGGGGGPARRR